LYASIIYCPYLTSPIFLYYPVHRVYSIERHENSTLHRTTRYRRRTRQIGPTHAPRYARLANRGQRNGRRRCARRPGNRAGWGGCRRRERRSGSSRARTQHARCCTGGARRSRRRCRRRRRRETSHGSGAGTARDHDAAVRRAGVADPCVRAIPKGSVRRAWHG